MNHEDAVRESSVEKYILGELQGEQRDSFEDHLFDCELCSADLKAGVTFLEAASDQLAPAASSAAVARPSRLAWLFNPVWMAPALAACLGLLGYQSLVVLPAARMQVAQANTPAVLHTLVLAAGTSRGAAVRKIVAPKNGSFLLSFDIPARTEFAHYRCSLRRASGELLWQGDISAAEAKDTVLLRIPSSPRTAGLDTFLIEGARPAGSGDDTVVELSQYEFQVQLQD
jgi:hypothetical protein